MLCLDNENISIFASEKNDGDILFKKENPELNEKIRANRISFFAVNQIDPKRLVNFAGIHGINIFKVKEADLGRGSLHEDSRIPKTDGLITDIKNSYLMITGADCFPVMFWDENKKFVGAAHCGWHGIIDELPTKMIRNIVSEFGSSTSNINVWIGPGIKNCHYSIDKERAELFSKNYKNHIIERDTQIFLDLAGIIAIQLTVSGVKSESITTHPDCTFCEKDKYFSHRRDQSDPIEANAFIIHLK